ncbi:HoxN/HupN/NixA family nickel/cobalt transporter [Terrihabitans sp. B22-R8]|uniref:HoxN/HupN/NixA family nickel/cobalt transporter n=1 Tax=Terrihabitans sp. B22-R8 TaxID=3425128 RepID=UPI00403C7C80
MTARILSLLVLLCLGFAAEPAHAHPHVFVTVRGTVDYAEGLPRAIRYAWRFDEMFSAYATQGLDADGDGKLSREELGELAQINIDSLREFDYFTFGKAGPEPVVFNPPRDYWLEHDGTALTLHFTLPLADPQEATREAFTAEIYDPTYFVAFAFPEGEAVTLAGAPQECRLRADGPKELPQASAATPLTEDDFNLMDGPLEITEEAVNRLAVRCGDGPEVAAAPPALAGDTSGTLTAEDRSLEAPAGSKGTDVAARVNQAQDLAQAQQNEAEQAARAQPQTSSGSAGALGAFGLGRPDGAGGEVPRTGFFGWIAQQQSAFYQSMSQALLRAKTDGSAFALLAGLSFAYGVFHAAGPGHGKAVISSYLVATGETLRRGVLISFAAAMAQALAAVLIVGILAGIVGITSREMGIAAWWLELASYVLIAGVGANLILRRGRALLAWWRGEAVAHDHVCGDDCGHQHMPGPEQLGGGEFGWRRAALAVLAVGLRPCTGALLILVFAMAQGMVWAGVAATFAMAVGTALTVSAIAVLSVSAKGLALRLAAGTSGDAGIGVGRGLEMAAGCAVLAFGLALMTGQLAAGTPMG